ncbi:hypothetical protein [Pollutimonas sp. M17]|uniref:hypothetical protein n=1 Tax=Pollutimonas sp. M17 TaxID=2962065 RepID=UPI0021F4C0E4|nr:hypothetical protein [Pollutimonas sp. M17]UYO95041.1 hypothetical protein OEG81_06960 [Pollutimonas sp. M17]
MNAQLPELKIKRIEDEFGKGPIFLEQDTSGGFDHVPSCDEQAQAGFLSGIPAMLIGQSKRERHAERTSEWVSNSQSCCAVATDLKKARAHKVTNPDPANPKTTVSVSLTNLQGIEDETTCSFAEGACSTPDLWPLPTKHECMDRLGAGAVHPPAIDLRV